MATTRQNVQQPVFKVHELYRREGRHYRDPTAIHQSVLDTSPPAPIDGTTVLRRRMEPDLRGRPMMKVRSILSRSLMTAALVLLLAPLAHAQEIQVAGFVFQGTSSNFQGRQDGANFIASRDLE